MNLKLKHSLLAMVALFLLLATLYVPGRANNADDMKDIKFGYPFSFVSEDFSKLNEGFQYYPNYERFVPFSKDFPVNNFSFPRFLFAYLIFFGFLEILVWLLETADFKIRKAIYKE